MSADSSSPDAPYNDRSLRKITEKYEEIGRVHDRLLLRMSVLMSKLKMKQAVEFLMQGAGRRLGILVRCIENIFEIYPPDRTEHLARGERLDVEINLHAFFVNVSGLFDNLAWVVAHELDLVREPEGGKLKRVEVGLFNSRTQAHLPERLRNYLQSDKLQTWYREYSKNYRDALAHRIPLYLPSAIHDEAARQRYIELELQMGALDFTAHENRELYDQLLEQQQQLGRVGPFFVHSFGEGSRPVYLHAQLLADYATAEGVVLSFCEHFGPGHEVPGVR